mmetsp:Transcript_7913/g.12553  ORF Transcript_7913/g.12553 Transcript_7913/m.12553 type:complete len:124 (+) Transcript_7913:226-597(+)
MEVFSGPVEDLVAVVEADTLHFVPGAGFQIGLHIQLAWGHVADLAASEDMEHPSSAAWEGSLAVLAAALAATVVVALVGAGPVALAEAVFVAQDAHHNETAVPVADHIVQDIGWSQDIQVGVP